MNATDKLLTLLKEQGFEHYRHEAPAEEDCVAFYDGNRWHDCWESVDGEVNVTFSMTPQEAIAATVGDAGMCHAEETEHVDISWQDGRRLTIHVMECDACGGTYEHVNGSYEYCPRCGAKVVDE